MFQRLMRLSTLLLAAWAGPACAGEIVLQVDGIRNAQGQLIVSVFSAETRDSFPKHPEGAVKRILVPAQAPQQTLRITDLKEGPIAISVVHDENGNGTMDHDFFGRPKEGFGFSNNPKVRFSLPSFDESSLAVQGGERRVDISLTYW